MAIGINDYDDIDDFSPSELEEEEDSQELYMETSEDDYIGNILRSKGIKDPDDIKFQDDEGYITSRSWEDLNDEERANILASPEDIPDENILDNEEVQLLNAIRASGMTPSEYFRYVQNSTINQFVLNNTPAPQMTVDQYSDDEVYLADIFTRFPDITLQEALSILDDAKDNEELYKKQVNNIRQDYIKKEKDNIAQEQYSRQYAAELQYEQFARSIADEINNFSEFQGYNIAFNESDMQELYDFITTADQAGNNYFAKALSDPKTLVQTAWFTLHGPQIIQDITDYFTREISQVRLSSYEKGLRDGKEGRSQFVYRPQKGGDHNNYYNDLDDF